MKLDVDWHETAPNAAVEERATVADLRIVVGGHNVCAHAASAPRGASGEGGHVAVSVYPIAEHLAFHWWSLFGARDLELRLIDGRSGYAIPDVRMRFDGADLDVVCRPHDSPGTPVRFVRGAAERLTREGAERALDDFVERVAGRLRARRVGACALQPQWRRVRASRDDVEEAAFCEAAGALALDPYATPEPHAAFIEAAGALFAGEPLLELLSGLRRSQSEPDGPPHAALDWVRAAETRPGHRSRVPALEGARDALAQARRRRPGERPWAAGYRCARQMRRCLNVGPAERLDLGALLARLDARRLAPAGAVSGLHAVVRSDRDAVHVHLPETSVRCDPARSLFTMARALGDALACPRAERSVVNDLHAAYRQAAGRAFAAELLAPLDEVLSMSEDGRDVRTIACELGVTEGVVAGQIESRARIESACRTQSREQSD